MTRAVIGLLIGLVIGIGAYSFLRGSIGSDSADTTDVESRQPAPEQAAAGEPAERPADQPATKPRVSTPENPDIGLDPAIEPLIETPVEEGELTPPEHFDTGQPGLAPEAYDTGEYGPAPEDSLGQPAPSTSPEDSSSDER